MRRFLSILAIVCVTASGASAATVALNPTDDTFLRGGTFATTTHGTETRLRLKEEGGPNFTRRALLGFDLTSVTQPVLSASLSLTLASTSALTTLVQVYAFSETTLGWDESTATWSNAPAMGAAGLSPVSPVTTLLGSFAVSTGTAAGTVFNFSSQSLLDFLNDPGTGNAVTFGLRSTNTTSSAILDFASKENTTYADPTLTLSVVPLPAAGLLLLGALGLVAVTRRRKA